MAEITHVVTTTLGVSCDKRGCTQRLMLPEPILQGRRPVSALMAEIRHLLVMAGYRVRPFDVLADRRRWCWQRRTRCVVVDPTDRRCPTLPRVIPHPDFPECWAVEAEPGDVWGVYGVRADAVRDANDPTFWASA